MVGEGGVHAPMGIASVVLTEWDDPSPVSDCLTGIWDMGRERELSSVRACFSSPSLQTECELPGTSCLSARHPAVSQREESLSPLSSCHPVFHHSNKTNRLAVRKENS